MRRSLGYGAVLVALSAAAVAVLAGQVDRLPLLGVAAELWLVKLLSGVALVAGAYGVYLLAGELLDAQREKRALPAGADPVRRTPRAGEVPARTQPVAPGST